MEIEGYEQNIKDLEDKIQDAKENLGDTDVREALLQKVNF